MKTPPRLQVAGLTVGYGERTILNQLSFQMGHRGVLALMGPAGVGKSTLLRTLSRWNDSFPSFWHRGRILLEGRELFQDLGQEQVRQQMRLLIQRAQLFTASVLDNLLADLSDGRALSRQEKQETAHRVLDSLGLWGEFKELLDEPVVHLAIGRQRRLAIVRLAAGAPRCLLLDEPFRDLPDGEQSKLESLLRRVALRLPLVLGSHNQNLVRRVAQQVALLAGGELVELAATEEFFTNPRHELTRRYLRDGNCWPRPAEPQPDPSPAEVARETASRRPAASTSLRSRRPSEFHWILPGLLAGCQQPGLLQELGPELAGLRELGCEVLINLRQTPPDDAAVRRAGMESHHVPIVDMGVPSPETTRHLCREISTWIDQARTTVVHCKAGLGRTGTLLACVLIYRGATPLQAIDRVRSINPRYIQSTVQLEFLDHFARHLERHEGERAEATT